MSFEFDNVLPVLDITEDAINITPKEEETEVEELDNPVLEDEDDDQLVEGDTKVSTLLFKELSERGIVSGEDKEEFTWDDIDNSLKKYTEDLPLKVAQSLIESLPEEGRALMNYLLTKQANLTKDDLTQYYEEHLKTTLTSIDNEDVARDYLREHYKGKFRASQITAMLDALEDEEGLVEEANKIKEELKREKERTLDQERQSQVTSQKQFVQSLSSEFQQLPWDTNRIEKVKQSIVSGEGNAKLAKIAQSPNGLIHLYNFMTYFDETNGKFDLTDFAKIATTKQVKGLKDSLTEDMLSSASNSTKASNRKIGGIDISKLQPIID